MPAGRERLATIVHHEHARQQLQAALSEPRLVADLLRACVPGPWQEADFGTLERVNASYVDERERQRHDDMVWRLRVGQRWVWVYLLLEFQQTPESHMALRMLGYVALLAQHLVREKQCHDDGRIPLLLPIVLYSGDAPWTAPQQVADLFDVSLPTLRGYAPQLRYVLLQQRLLARHRVPEQPNLAQTAFELEQSDSLEEVKAVLQALQGWLADEASAPLRRHLSLWLRNWLRRSRLNATIDTTTAKDDTHLDLLEPAMKLHEKIDRWLEEAEARGWQKGAQQGVAQGLTQGRHQGLARAVELQLRLKFGDLPEQVHEWLQTASDDQLERCLEKILSAQTLGELLA